MLRPVARVEGTPGGKEGRSVEERKGWWSVQRDSTGRWWPAPHQTVCGEGAVLSEDRLCQARGKGGTRYTVGMQVGEGPPGIPLELAAAQRDARRIAVL